jgi:hypothetical protein
MVLDEPLALRVVQHRFGVGHALIGDPGRVRQAVPQPDQRRGRDEKGINGAERRPKMTLDKDMCRAGAGTALQRPSASGRPDDPK